MKLEKTSARARAQGLDGLRYAFRLREDTFDRKILGILITSNPYSYSSSLMFFSLFEYIIFIARTMALGIQRHRRVK